MYKVEYLWAFRNDYLNESKAALRDFEILEDGTQLCKLNL